MQFLINTATVEMIARRFIMRLGKGGPKEGHVALEHVSDGEKIEIECSATGSDVKNLILLKDQREIKSGVKTKGRNKILKIDKFDGAKHVGIYHCAAPNSSGGALESSLVLKRRSPVTGTPFVEECRENICRNGGKCFVPVIGDKAPFCSCPPEYAGQYCESHTISSYAVQSTQAGILIWSLASTVFLLLILVGLLVFFIHRYRKERVKRRRYQSKYGKLSDAKGNTDGTHDIENSVEMDLLTKDLHSHQTTNNPMPSYRTIDDLEDFENYDTLNIHQVENFHTSKNEPSEVIRKSSGFRERLDGTSTMIS